VIRLLRCAAVAALALLVAYGAARAQNSSALLNPLNYGKFGPQIPTELAPNPGKNSSSGSLMPVVGPLPPPVVGSSARCPPGYVEPSNVTRMPHLVVCTVAQPNFGKTYNGVPYQTQNYGKSGPGGVGVNAVGGTPMPAAEYSHVNQCAGRPGSYACGRGGTECCSPSQDNMCFAGAYACSVPLATAGQGKQACCMTR
jgi:hypothetical protein